MKSQGMLNKKRDNYKTKYKTIKQLGEGGNAIVYEATDISSSKVVALKALSKWGKEKESRFDDEIDTLLKLNSNRIDGVLPIYDYSKPYKWYTMPIATSIIEYIKANNLNVDKIVDGTIDLAESLVKIHGLDIAHRDIKPANVYFYNERFSLGDFGLVEIPQNNHNNTRSDKGLGAIFTIAPEMKRDPKNADGKKADVYSLAKTLWMFLTLEEKGFDGQYNFLDNSHRLHNNRKYDDTHLVEIEELLVKSTDNNPDSRPTMSEFCNALKEWKRIWKDKKLSQVSDWIFITELIFGEYSPQSAVFSKIDDIVKVLNIVSKSPAMNHFLFVRGGLDLEKVEKAKEQDCIYIYTDGFCQVAKPKCLFYESFVDSRWNYFLLELAPLSLAVGKEFDEYEERVVEDCPGHYVSAIDACYGVYDYDTGKPLPSEYKIVYRLLKGKMLIVLKTGPYNHIAGTYDGRHNDCSTEKFRDYVGSLSNTVSEKVSQGICEEKVLLLSDVNPFKTEPYKPQIPENALPDAKPYISEHYSDWDFSDVIIKKDNESDMMRFYFEFKLNGCLCFPFEEKQQYVLFADGRIKESPESQIDSEIFYTTNRDEAIRIEAVLNERIESLCENYDYDVLNSPHFHVLWKSTGAVPAHLFTRDEIEKLMREADDRRGNKLVIDENGYAQMLPPDARGDLYPVSHETYCERNNYVGKYSNLPTLDSDFHDSLAAWKDYLELGCHEYCDGSEYSCESDEKLIEDILQLMKNLKNFE